MEHEIHTLIERWAEAVHRGDLDAVLADHADDIVMFDVPPPHRGVRGLDAYAATWPDFFAWQAAGAVFELVELEVTAGADVAVAHALLRCGTPDDLARRPDALLRLTVGLRRKDGRWIVHHEHHSFADTSSAPDEAGVRQVHHRWSELTRDRDLDGLMATIADDVVSYEHAGPLAYHGGDAVRTVCAQGLDAAPVDTPIDMTTPDLRVHVSGDLAVSWGLDRVRVGEGDAAHDVWSRSTRVFERRAGRWMMVHQHLSFPMDPDSGMARTDLAP